MLKLQLVLLSLGMILLSIANMISILLYLRLKNK